MPEIQTHDLSETLDVSFESIEQAPVASTQQATDYLFRLSLRHLSKPSSGIDLVVRSTTLGSYVYQLTKILNSSPQTKNGHRVNRKSKAVHLRSIWNRISGEKPGFRLETSLLWETGVSVVETVGPKSPVGRVEMAMLNTYVPNNDSHSQWSIQDFYDAVHVPPTDQQVPSQIGRCFSETKLYPFQARAVQWLLAREGVAFPEPGGALVPIQIDDNSMISFKPFEDADGRVFHVSHLRGLIVSGKPLLDAENSLKGGILAEEMGLGKTVELIALMCHHQRTNTQEKIYDDYTGSHVAPSSATLIITPPSILQQWKSEILDHAPHLKVFHYEGMPPVTTSKNDPRHVTVETLLKYDVVLTTYHVLSREIHHAKPPPDRNMRHKKQYEHRRSPLVGVSWWRVCLDEAQMVESGVSQAAIVARVIPRVNAWAVSGTPVRKDVLDLRGLLTFLRHEPYASSKAVWDRLDKATFKDLFSRISMRHAKDKIRDELRIPPQRRIVVTLPFTAIEQQHYSELIREMCETCGVSPEGMPTMDGQTRDDPALIEKLRVWLLRLRQTCLHANVGSRNKKALGANAPLRTVHEVLEVMIEKTDTALKAAARDLVSKQILMAHILANAGDNPNRSLNGKVDYEAALRTSVSWVQTCRKELEEEMQKHGLNIESGMNSLQLDDDEDEDEKGANLGRIPAMRKSLRSFLELEHVCRFFIATMYFQIKSNSELLNGLHTTFEEVEKKEADFYDQAKIIRNEVLHGSKAKAQQHITKLSERDRFSLPRIDFLTKEGGIEIETVLETFDSIAEALDDQAALLESWRAKALKILLLPLVDSDDKETTGDEYEDSTKAQDELYVYIMALRTAIADRKLLLNGQHDLLVTHEFDSSVDQANMEKGHAPELVLKIAQERKRLELSRQTSLKGVISAVRSLMTNLQWKTEDGDSRARLELAIAERHLAKIQQIATAQTKAVAELEKEIEQFRGAMNQRLEFYRQLQHISDQVVPYKEQLDERLDVHTFNKAMDDVQAATGKISTYTEKLKYLVNLRQENKSGDQAHSCAICMDEFEIGILTPCGHTFCKECLFHWWKSRQAKKSCPSCRTMIRASDFIDITYKPLDIKAQEEVHENGKSPSPSATIYSDMSSETMKQIKAIDLGAVSYGTKIDMLARHLLWIRANDPGAKSIIFSQFSDFLDVLQTALLKFKIGCTSIRSRNGIDRFKKEEGIEVFLLDAKSDSSGLNLVRATYVFLAEPLIQTALELQAVARVHRIGQGRATTVFCYLVEGTVEEAVYGISVRRRLEHLGGSASSSEAGDGEERERTPGVKEVELERADAWEAQMAPIKGLLGKRGDGEVVGKEDVWACLFGGRRGRETGRERSIERVVRAEAAEERREAGLYF